MNRHIKPVSVLASVMVMILCVPVGARADGGRYDDDWNRGGYGWNDHDEDYRGHYAPYYPTYYRRYYPDDYPRYYPHHYPPYSACGTYTKKKPHHNNHDHWW